LWLSGAWLWDVSPGAGLVSGFSEWVFFVQLEYYSKYRDNRQRRHRAQDKASMPLKQT